MSGSFHLSTGPEQVAPDTGQGFGSTNNAHTGTLTVMTLAPRGCVHWCNTLLSDEESLLKGHIMQARIHKQLESSHEKQLFRKLEVGRIIISPCPQFIGPKRHISSSTTASLNPTSLANGQPGWSQRHRAPLGQQWGKDCEAPACRHPALQTRQETKSL